MYLVSLEREKEGGAGVEDEPLKVLFSVNTVNFLGNVGSLRRRVLDRAHFKDNQINIIKPSNLNLSPRAH